ncbi:MAG: 2-oxoacid:acceptor oxidoreductase family protein [Clostridia bacterium]|nr:2-oxoacid:acceptor oxidoreductase family protein [Clostridia bacterium]MBR2417917.1 2-oxoacid:acceptor oxidoreductase family protein [Clostridia bacterium]
MSTTQILIAGFGGQGVLFAGKLIAYKGLLENKQISWLPSYGPEMRGGTANCSVIVSDTPVGSPIVTKPDVLVAMNLPSLKKYENEVVSGGTIIIDSTLIAEKVQRDDVEVYYVPATKMAADEGFSTLANMILIGKLMKVCENVGYDMVEDAVKKVVPPRKANLIDVNLKAVKLGYEF